VIEVVIIKENRKIEVMLVGRGEHILKQGELLGQGIR